MDYNLTAKEKERLPRRILIRDFGGSLPNEDRNERWEKIYKDFLDYWTQVTGIERQQLSDYITGKVGTKTVSFVLTLTEQMQRKDFSLTKEQFEELLVQWIEKAEAYSREAGEYSKKHPHSARTNWAQGKDGRWYPFESSDIVSGHG